MATSTPPAPSSRTLNLLLRELTGARMLAISPRLIRAVDSANAAVLLTYLLQAAPHAADDAGWFVAAKTRIEQETGLPDACQDAALTQLTAAGIVETGGPKGGAWRINLDQLLLHLEAAALPAPDPPADPPPIAAAPTDPPTTLPAPPADRYDAATTNKILVAKMEQVGIGVTPYLVDCYLAEVQAHGLNAVLLGMQSAADAGLQSKRKYVIACIESAATGRRPPSKADADAASSPGQPPKRSRAYEPAPSTQAVYPTPAEIAQRRANLKRIAEQKRTGTLPSLDERLTNLPPV